MQKRIELTNRKGFTLILAVLLIMVFLGVAVMAVDVGHMQVLRADVHAAADAAALAGIEKYGATSDTGQAKTEAALYANKFKADRDSLVIASFTVGGWDVTKSHPNAFVPLGTAGSIPADDVVVQHVGHYVFAQTLYGHISQHTASATSIAVGQAKKEVTKSTCVAPIVLPLSALFHEIGDKTKGNSDTLTASDITKLSGTSSNPITLPLQNGTKVTTLDSVFYQAQFPPTMTADGIQHGGQSNSASFYRNAITCTGGVAPVGVGDWLGAVNGTKANQTQMGLANADGGALPVTVEVVLADSFGSPKDKFGVTVSGCPCLHVGYVGAFTFTADGNKSITGYFTTLSPLSGGVVSSDTLHSSPLGQITKLRLVY